MFTIKNQQISIYSVGQNLQSGYKSLDSTSARTFGIFNINKVTNKSTEIQLEVKASSQYGTASTNISVFLWNNQYLESNPDFQITKSPLTSGTIDVTTSNFSAIVPVDALLGNNIKYYLLIDNNLILRSDYCLDASSICIENKLFTISDSEYFTYDFLLNDNIMLATSNNNISIFNISADFVPIYYSAISFSNFFQNPNTNFIFIDVFIDNYTLISVATWSQAKHYALFTGTFFGEVLSSFNISYTPLWMKISQIGSFVYLYDSIGLYVFIVENNILQYQTYYTDATFNVSFNPISAEYYNESTILIGDMNMGAVFIQQNTLYQYIPIPNNGELAGLYKLSTSIIMLLSSGDGYQISTLNFTILQHYYSLSAVHTIPSNFQGAINEKEGIIIYPIYLSYSDTGHIRVANITSGYIIADYEIIRGSESNRNFWRIAFSITNPYIFYHDLFDVERVYTIMIRNQISVYIHKESDKKSNSVLQLIGITNGKELKLNPVEIIYYDKPSDGSKNGTSDNNIYDKWWFWVIVAGSFMLLVVIGMAIYKKRKSICHSNKLMIHSTEKIYG